MQKSSNNPRERDNRSIITNKDSSIVGRESQTWLLSKHESMFINESSQDFENFVRPFQYNIKQRNWPIEILLFSQSF